MFPGISLHLPGAVSFCFYFSLLVCSTRFFLSLVTYCSHGPAQYSHSSLKSGNKQDNHLQASSYKVLREGLFGQYIHPSQVTWDLEGGAPGLLPTRENSGLFPWKKSQWGGQGWGPGGRWPGWVAPSFNRQWGVREVFELIFFIVALFFSFMN